MLKIGVEQVKNYLFETSLSLIIFINKSAKFKYTQNDFIFPTRCGLFSLSSFIKLSLLVFKFGYIYFLKFVYDSITDWDVYEMSSFIEIIH